jgi:hypothetical protein
MDPVFLIILIVVVFSVLSVLGTVAWWVFVFWAGKKALTAMVGSLDSLLPQIEAQLQAYRNLPPAQRAGQEQQIVAMMFKMNQQMRQIESLHRSRYEARAGEIASMAASAGISYTPPSW